MLLLCLDGIMMEICASEIAKIYGEESCTNLVLKDDREVTVDDTEENVRKVIRDELMKINTTEKFIRLHLYYGKSTSDFYPICIPISAIKSVSRGYYAYDMRVTGKLASDIPEQARETDSEFWKPAIIFLKYPILDSRKDMVEKITVYESADYVMKHIK